jgi:hypothetical protein
VRLVAVLNASSALPWRAFFSSLLSSGGLVTSLWIARTIAARVYFAIIFCITFPLLGFLQPDCSGLANLASMIVDQKESLRRFLESRIVADVCILNAGTEAMETWVVLQHNVREKELLGRSKLEIVQIGGDLLASPREVDTRLSIVHLMPQYIIYI